MGKKTRRTKWRRLSLGEASEGEEDEQQQQQQQTEEQQQQPEVDQVTTTENNDTSTVLTHCSDKKKKNSLVNESIIPSAVIMPGHPAGVEERTGGGAPAWKPAQQAPVNKSSAPPAFYPSNTNNHYSNGYSTGPGTRPAASAGSFRRGGGGGAPRYNNSNSYNGNSNGYNGPSYGRANSWNSGSYNNDHHHHSHHQPPGGLGKTHGIEKKIFNDEEYTKISTPRQEVLFKKGSIGAKKRSPVVAPATAVGTEQSDAELLHSPSSPVRLNGDADSFHYSGNDSGSTGDASSTAGEAQSPDAALQGYDGTTPLVCFPMYDFYGGYGGMYPAGGMLVQTYPGGPLVAAVPVPMQPVPWNGSTGANGAGPGGEMAFYYALGYPAGDMSGALQLEAGVGGVNGSRRNSLESYQASSHEVMTGSEASSENSSPCSTGPSSQGPASPQGEMVSPAIDPNKAQTGGAAVTAAAAVMADMAASGTVALDNRPHQLQQHHQKMTVAGFVYPFPYGIAPPALYASGSEAGFYLDDNYYYGDYCNVEEEGMANYVTVDDYNGNPTGEEEVAMMTTAPEPPPKPVPVVVENLVPGLSSSASMKKNKKKKRKKKKKNKVAAASSSSPPSVNCRGPVQLARVIDEEEDEGEEEEEEEEETCSRSTSSPVSDGLDDVLPTPPSPPAPDTSPEQASSSSSSSPPSSLPLSDGAESSVDVVDASGGSDNIARGFLIESCISSDSISTAETVFPTSTPPPLLPVSFQPDRSPLPHTSNDAETTANPLLPECSSPDPDPPSSQSPVPPIEDPPSATFPSTEEEEVSPATTVLIEASSTTTTSPIILVLPSISCGSSNDSAEEDEGSMERDSLDEPAELEEDDYVQVDDGELQQPDREDESPEISLFRLDPPLWKTVILEESEPMESTFDASSYLPDTSSFSSPADDSGIVVKEEGPGPIVLAVSQWLESAPIHQQLLVDPFGKEEEDEDDEEGEEEGDITVPKNGLPNPCTAPSSELVVTDGPQRRVGHATTSTPAADRDCKVNNNDEEEEEEPLGQPLNCDPAKFSVYYQLGVTLDEEDGGGDVNVVDVDDIQQCPTEASNGKKNKKDGASTKRNSWRRILKARRSAVQHKSQEEDVMVDGVKTRRPKAGQSCCAVQ